MVIIMCSIASAQGICAPAGGLKTVLDTAYSTTFVSVASLIGGTAYIGGLAFGVVAVIKFKQHRDNPAQVTIGVPINMLIVSIGLIYLPSLLIASRDTLFTSTVDFSYVGVNPKTTNPWGGSEDCIPNTTEGTPLTTPEGSNTEHHIPHVENL